MTTNLDVVRATRAATGTSVRATFAHPHRRERGRTRRTVAASARASGPAGRCDGYSAFTPFLRATSPQSL